MLTNLNFKINWLFGFMQVERKQCYHQSTTKVMLIMVFFLFFFILQIIKKDFYLALLSNLRVKTSYKLISFKSIYITQLCELSFPERLLTSRLLLNSKVIVLLKFLHSYVKQWSVFKAYRKERVNSSSAFFVFFLSL